MMEQWKAIPCTNDCIEVSNQGNIRSLLRGPARALKTQTDNKGYQRIAVTIEREKKTFKVHREVAKAFIPNPDNKPQVNHIDGNKENNNVGNLEWVTNKENCNHAIQNGLWDTVIAGSRIENESRRKPIIASMNGIEQRFNSIADAERVIGTKHINAVLSGKRSHAKGYSFRYVRGGDAT